MLFRGFCGPLQLPIVANRFKVPSESSGSASQRLFPPAVGEGFGAAATASVGGASSATAARTLRPSEEQMADYQSEQCVGPYAHAFGTVTRARNACLKHTH